MRIELEAALKLLEHEADSHSGRDNSFNLKLAWAKVLKEIEIERDLAYRQGIKDGKEEEREAAVIRQKLSGEVGHPSDCRCWQCRTRWR